MGRRVQAFLLLGIASGLVCGLGGRFLPDIRWLQNAYPGVILGLFLFFAGRYIAHRSGRKPLSALLVTISAGIIGWSLAVKVGTDSGIEPLFLYAVCGLVGAACVAVGLLYAWRIRNGILPFVLTTLLAGALGGFLFHLLERLAEISAVSAGLLWTTLLFTLWQAVLMAGLAIALRFTSGRS